MHRFAILFSLLFSLCRVSAQPVLPVSKSLLFANGEDISQYCLFFTDTSIGKLPFSEIKNASFQSFDNFRKNTPKQTTHSKSILWIKLTTVLINDTNNTSINLDLDRQGEILLYNEQGLELQKTGTYYFPYSAEQWPPVSLKLKYNDTTVCYLRIMNRLKQSNIPFVRCYSNESFRNYLAAKSSSQIKEYWFMFLLAGLIFTMALFGFTQYLYTKKKYYLYYSLFCMLGCATQVWNTNYYFSIGLPLQMKSANQLFAYGIAICYALFINDITHLSGRQPKIWLIIKMIIAVIGIQSLISVYEYFNDLAFDSMLYYDHKSDPIILLSFFLFCSLLTYRGNIRNYLLYGIGFVMISHFIVASGVIGKINSSALRNVLLYLTGGLGIFLENFLFLLAMAYQHQQTSKEHLNMQKSYSDSLEQQLSEKTTEIRQAELKIRKQELQKVEHLYRARIAETEMAALRSQMNPHFTFNCINSIDSFIYANDKYNATLYLNKFARLLRNVLESSKENTIPLDREIETLKLYIELEELRHDHLFKTIISLQEDLLEGNYRVPPMIIQPFVENAILHGLKNKTDQEGLLQIEVSAREDFLEITVTDNGIGRLAAMNLKQVDQPSFGIQMSSERIRLFNEETIPSLEIEDMYNEAHLPTGTRVKAKIKIRSTTPIT